MNVLLVITNVNGEHEIPFSFGLTSIASYINNKGYNTKIIAIHEENEYHKIHDEIKSFNPGVVGFTAVSSQFSCIKHLAKMIKKINKDIIIVCGGIHATLFPDALLETNDIDGFFIGESEIAFGDFLDKIRGNKDFRVTNNFYYRNNGKVVANPLNPLITNIENLPHPMLDSLFEEYINTNGQAPFFFSRGCPYICTYCCNDAYARLYGMKRNKPRYRSVDSCIEEIKIALEKYKFNVIWMADNIFAVDKKWRSEFCEKYKKEINIKFICNLQVNVINEEYVKTLKDAGCFRVAMSIESGNEYIRNTIMKRNMSEKQILEAYMICKKYKIKTQSINIIGLPYETEDMLWETIKLNRKVKPTQSGVNIFYPYKGTQLGDYCFSEGLVDEEMYDTFSFERRDSVLNFPSEHKEKLRYYHKNWKVLVDPYNVKKRLISYLQNHKTVYNNLRKIKHTLFDGFLKN